MYWNLLPWILIVLGVLMLFRPFIEMYIKFTNSISGRRTVINNSTITAQRLIGVVIILIGLGLMFGIGQ